MAGGLDIGAVVRSPILLATFILSFVAWFIAFISQCVGEGRTRGNGGVPGYGVLWFAIWLQILVTVFFFIACASDTVGRSRFQLSIFLAICVVFSVMGVQNIYVKGFAPSTATGVGWLLLCIVDLIWLLFLTADEDTRLYQTFTSGGHMSGWSGSATGGRRQSGRASRAEAGFGSESSGLRANGAERGMTSHDLGYGNGIGSGGSGMMGGTLGYQSPVTAHESPMKSSIREGAVSAASQQAQYKHKARANYSYTASPEDENEVSFTKGDVLEVMDTTGKWYQVRTPTGQMGIAPSNYLTLM